VFEMDKLPIPDFDDYFTQMEEMGLKTNFTHIPFESSRGCYWGEKNNCLFCGLNGYCIQYRKKTPERVIDEIQSLLDQYKPDFMNATDNIMPLELINHFYKHFIPPESLKGIYYEIKPLVPFEDLHKLMRTGIRTLQPGLESLNDNLLKQLNKGLTTANNIRFLRDCRTLGIRTDWNILHSIPGEALEDYSAMINLFPLLHHLKYPDFIGPVNVQRFSPLFEDPTKYNLGKLTPLQIYSELFPTGTKLDKIALYFDSEFETIFKGKIEKEFLQKAQVWRDSWKDDPPKLQGTQLTEDFLLIEDTRLCALQPIRVLTPDYQEIIRDLRLPLHSSRIDENNPLFYDLLDWKLIAKVGNRYISLICETLRATEGVD
ncbi:MAG: RiPP maturation radical SAM C-methyltransferase, partial [Candidatus Hodarchaeales archaeon]